MITRALVLSFITLLCIPSAAMAAPTSSIACTLTASDRYIDAGDTVTIWWKSAGAVLFVGPDGAKIAPFGSMQVAPTQTTIYKFKFIGIGGNEKCGVRIRVKGDEPTD